MKLQQKYTDIEQFIEKIKLSIHQIEFIEQFNVEGSI